LRIAGVRIFTDRMPFLSPNQQCQSTEGTLLVPSRSWKFF